MRCRPNSTFNMHYISGCGSVWLERRLREAEAASSNLVTPTKKGIRKDSLFWRIFISPPPGAEAEKTSSGRFLGAFCRTCTAATREVQILSLRLKRESERIPFFGGFLCDKKNRPLCHGMYFMVLTLSQRKLRPSMGVMVRVMRLFASGWLSETV